MSNTDGFLQPYCLKNVATMKLGKNQQVLRNQRLCLYCHLICYILKRWSHVIKILANKPPISSLSEQQLRSVWVTMDSNGVKTSIETSQITPAASLSSTLFIHYLVCYKDLLIHKNMTKCAASMLCYHPHRSCVTSNVISYVLEMDSREVQYWKVLVQDWNEKFLKMFW